MLLSTFFCIIRVRAEDFIASDRSCGIKPSVEQILGGIIQSRLGYIPFVPSTVFGASSTELVATCESKMARSRLCTMHGQQ